MTLNGYQVAICLQRIWVPFHAFSEADTSQSRNQGLQFAMLLGHLPCGYVLPDVCHFFGGKQNKWIQFQEDYMIKKCIVVVFSSCISSFFYHKSLPTARK